MVGRRDIAGWLDGPGAARHDPSAFPGERLGRPASGRGSVGRFGRRLLGIAIDWILAIVVARAFLGDLASFGPLLVLFAEHALLVGTAGGTIGHRLVGLRVEAVDGARPGPLRGLIRAVLLCLAVPALVWDADQRGLHDKLAGTLVART